MLSKLPGGQSASASIRYGYKLTGFSLTASENLASPTGTNEAEFGTSVGRCSNSGVPKDVTINVSMLEKT